jgi:tRNA (guanine6-N2)-methyltransferase
MPTRRRVNSPRPETVHRAAGRTPNPPQARKNKHHVEITFLPGMDDIVRDELDTVLSGNNVWRAVPNRNDSFEGHITGGLAPLLRLRTVVAPFIVSSFPISGPKLLLDGQYFPQVLQTIREVQALQPGAPPQSLRVEAAGRDSPLMRNIARQFAQAAGLQEDPIEGDCLVRIRPNPSGNGWDVLVRAGTRPLSARQWRTESYDAAVNATVAAAMVRLSSPRADDRIANPMCGSGTLLVERLLAAPSRSAFGFDLAPEAAAAAEQHLLGARLTERAELLVTDLRDDAWLTRGPFDCFFSDPPWGDKSGRHEDNEELHTLLLERCHRVAAGGARLVVLTHEVRIMERCLRRAEAQWHLKSQHRIFQKGHHPRIYVLRRV